MPTLHRHSYSLRMGHRDHGPTAACRWEGLLQPTAGDAGVNVPPLSDMQSRAALDGRPFFFRGRARPTLPGRSYFFRPERGLPSITSRVVATMRSMISNVSSRPITTALRPFGACARNSGCSTSQWRPSARFMRNGRNGAGYWQDGVGSNRPVRRDYRPGASARSEAALTTAAWKRSRFSGSTRALARSSSTSSMIRRL